ncbi:UBA/TS-N domain containing protein [Histomonas meleagridis]|uniref:UBA/TS-N domain containing protein n=1 Tax=Histomonas meleagridis TaxID=135588 RepID=UPI00355A880C|nr:UBA/TS-N domain containing protein [Histomonas meleagridis]KAH0805150.1 UBA/TS-N domain containing protein [Histomonas meleagridis]
MSDDDEEVVIEDDDDENFTLPSSQIDPPLSKSGDPNFFNHILCFINYLPNFNATLSDNILSFKVPKDVLPLSLQMVCGFHFSPTLLDIELTFKTLDWDTPLEKMKVLHPIFKTNYVGRPLVEDAIRNFFSPNYISSDISRASIYLFQARGVVDHKKLNQLIAENFDPKSAEIALVLCRNNINSARKFLLTGNLSTNATSCPVQFEDSPLIFLVIEIVNAFLDLNDHCCICRKKLPFSGIKPSICDSKLCAVGFNEIGVGTSVIQEIRRDPLAADWILTIYSGALAEPKYLNPSPPTALLDFSKGLLRTLPSMEDLILSCLTDSDISKTYGKNALEFLRWLLLTNKSQIISLPKALQIKEIPCEFQFMTLISSPSAELDFLQRKNQYGSIYQWHGSAGSRWYSIMQNGLKNMSRIPGEVVHGAAHGEGIYLASDSMLSFSYTLPVKNLYKNSKLGKNITMIGLCEIAKMPNGVLNSHGNEIKTLTDEKACIVRFVFATTKHFHVKATRLKAKSIPNLEMVLEYMGNQVQK